MQQANNNNDQLILKLLNEFNEMIAQREKDRATMSFHEYAEKCLKRSIAMNQKVKAMTFLREWAFRESTGGVPFVSGGAKQLLYEGIHGNSLAATPFSIFPHEAFRKTRRSRKKIVADKDVFAWLLNTNSKN